MKNLLGPKQMDQVRVLVKAQLQCAVCHDVKRSVLQCFNGHAHCTACIEQMREHARLNCSVCRVRRGWASNRLAVDIAKAAEWEWKCDVEGCEQMCTIEDIDAHRARCPMRRYECPIGCEVAAMPHEQLGAHVLCHRRHAQRAERGVPLFVPLHVMDVPKVLVLVLDTAVVCLTIAFRVSRVICLEVRAGVVGPSAPLALRIAVRDALSDDEYTLSQRLPNVESLACITDRRTIATFDNYVEAVDLEWNCVDVTNDDEGHRVACLSVCVE